MGFQITPTTKRKLKYASLIWDFDIDGAEQFVTTTPKSTSIIPENSVIVSVCTETLKELVNGVVPIFTIRGTGDVNIFALGPGNIATLGYVKEYDIAKKAGGLLNIYIMGDMYAGSFAVTFGYYESADYSYL